MTGCSASIKEYLNNPIELKIDDQDLDFKSIKQLADNKAKELTSQPMLLAWYNGKTGDFVPKAECGRGPKPGWISQRYTLIEQSINHPNSV